MKTNAELTPNEVKAMSLAEFDRRFGFRPKDALEKWGFIVTGKRMDQVTRGMMDAGILERPDLTGIVME